MATTTINTTAAEDAIIVQNVGLILGLKDGSGNPRNATAAEVKKFLIDYLKLRIYEQRQATDAQAAKTAVPADGGISPT